MWIMELLQLEKTTEEPYGTIRTNIINGIHGCVSSLCSSGDSYSYSIICDLLDRSSHPSLFV